MDQHIGIGMAYGTMGMFYLYTSKPEGLPFGQLMNIVAHANPVLRSK